MIRKALVILLCAIVSYPAPIQAVPTSEKEKQQHIQTLKASLPKSRRLLSVTFKETKIEDIFRFFSKEFRLNFVKEPAVTGLVSFSFHRVNPVDAFDSLMQSQGYDWYIHQGIIRVFQEKPIQVIPINYALGSDVLDAVTPILGDRGTVSLDENGNKLIVKAPGGDIRRISRIIKELDQPPLQVLVEVKIVEFKENDISKFGIGLQLAGDSSSIRTNGFAIDGSSSTSTTGTTGTSGTTGTTGTTGSNSTATGFFVKAISGNFQALLDAVLTKADTNVLAKPKILALNHKKASIITGEQLGFTVTSTTAVGSSESVQFLEVGTKLSFTPHISSTGEILMEITPEVSEGEIVNSVPQKRTTQAITNVMVRDGQTIIIGGLVREKKVDETFEVPVLSSLPFIDWLFKRETSTIEKREIAVLLTPHIITSESLKSLEHPASVKKSS